MNPNKSKRFGSRTGGVNSFTKMLKLESKSVSRSCLHDNLTALIGAMRISRSCKGLGGQTQLKNAFQTSPRRSRSVYLEVLQTDLKARLWCIQATFPPWFLKELNMCPSIYLFSKVQRKTKEVSACKGGFISKDRSLPPLTEMSPASWWTCHLSDWQA